VFLVASCSTPAGAACSRDDAFNKMMALSQYGMKLQAALPDPLKDAAGYNANYKRVIDFNTRLGDVARHWPPSNMTRLARPMTPWLRNTMSTSLDSMYDRCRSLRPRQSIRRRENAISPKLRGARCG